MRRIVFCILTVFLLAIKCSVCGATESPGDIARSEYADIGQAHHYYVMTLGLGCKQCGILPRANAKEGDYGYWILNHGGGLVSEAEYNVLVRDEYGNVFLSDRVGSSDYGSSVGPTSWWILMRYSKTLVVGGSGNTYDWQYGKSTLKSKYGDYKKYKSGKHAWSGLEQIPEKVVYGEGMGNIGDATFSNLSSMTSFVFCGDLVEDVGDFAFYDSHVLKDFTLDNSVKRIKNQAFALCPALESFSLNKNDSKLIFVGARAFKNAALKNWVCPDRLKQIGLAAFSGCAKLKNIEWSENSLLLSDYAFKNCFSLGYRVVHYVPKSVYQLGKYCFKNCV